MQYIDPSIVILVFKQCWFVFVVCEGCFEKNSHILLPGNFCIVPWIQSKRTTSYIIIIIICKTKHCSWRVPGGGFKGMWLYGVLIDIQINSSLCRGSISLPFLSTPHISIPNTQYFPIKLTSLVHYNSYRELSSSQEAF